MSRQPDRPRSRMVGARLGAVAVAVATMLLTHGVATAQEGDLRPQVRELEFRSRSLDGSEQRTQDAETTTVTLAADVLFAFDQADLTPEAQTRLDQLAAELAELGPRTVTISGHTDSRGDPTYNLDLSQRRAEAVHTALGQRLGGDFTFEVAGHGEDQPVAPNENEDGSDNPEGRALNRRVDIQYPTD